MWEYLLAVTNPQSIITHEFPSGRLRSLATWFHWFGFLTQKQSCGKHTGAFSSWTAIYFNQRLVETKPELKEKENGQKHDAKLMLLLLHVCWICKWTTMCNHIIWQLERIAVISSVGLNNTWLHNTIPLSHRCVQQRQSFSTLTWCWGKFDTELQLTLLLFLGCLYVFLGAPLQSH